MSRIVGFIGGIGRASAGAFGSPRSATGDALLAPSIIRRLIAEFAARPDPQQPTPRLAELTDRERTSSPSLPVGSATPRSPDSSSSAR